MAEFEIFKYCSFDSAVKILSSSSLIFNNAKSFNDPFDCDIDLLKFDFNDIGDEVKTDIINVKSIIKNEEQFPNSFIEKQMDIYASNGELEKVYKNGQIEKVKQNAVCCFSFTFENTCMWSHYANNHKGICLVFNVKEESPFIDISNDDISSGPVRYRDLKKDTPVNYLKNKLEGIETLLLTKSLDWKYEEEFRYISMNGPRIEKFQKSFLKGIIFGQRATDEQIEEIKKLCVNNFDDNVLFARMIKAGLDLNVESIDV